MFHNGKTKFQNRQFVVSDPMGRVNGVPFGQGVDAPRPVQINQHGHAPLHVTHKTGPFSSQKGPTLNPGQSEICLR